MKRLLHKLTQTKSCIIDFIMLSFYHFRKIAEYKSKVFLNEAVGLSEQHTNDITMYCKHYKNTLAYDAVELLIKWLEFKAIF